MITRSQIRKEEEQNAIIRSLQIHKLQLEIETLKCVLSDDTANAINEITLKDMKQWSKKYNKKKQELWYYG